MEVLTIKKIFLVAVFILCASCNRTIFRQINSGTGDLFLTIEWCGVTTRPPMEFGMATKGVLGKASQWAADLSADRRVAVIDRSDMGRIERLLGSNLFRMNEHIVRPDFRVQQYYINVRSDETPQFFYLGLNDATVSLLREMQKELSSDAAMKLQLPIDAWHRQANDWDGPNLVGPACLRPQPATGQSQSARIIIWQGLNGVRLGVTSLLCSPEDGQRRHPGISDVKNTDGFAVNRIRDVVLEAGKIAAPDILRDFRTGERMSFYPYLPSLVLVKERATQIGGGGKMPGGCNQFLLRESIERDIHRMACRAFRRTAAEGTPASPSTSIWSALIALTVASSMSSSRR
jgi:hypothetical protein